MSVILPHAQTHTHMKYMYASMHARTHLLVCMNVYIWFCSAL